MMLPFSHRFGLLAITGALALGAASMVAGAGCTVLTNDAPPDDAGLYEGGDVQVASCPSCVASECTAASALCLTNEGCLAVRDCAKAGDAGCGCGTNEDGGTRARDLYRAFEACTAARSCTGTWGAASPEPMGTVGKGRPVVHRDVRPGMRGALHGPRRHVDARHLRACRGARRGRRRRRRCRSD